MKKKLITKEHFTISPWKNGAGVTAEIAIDPPGSKFIDGTFNWRISSARIESETPFSQFNGYDRLLTVLSGDGLLLNSEELGPFEIFAFSGEERFECSLIDSPVEDLGIIFKRSNYQCKMQILDLAENTTVSLKEGVHFFMSLSPEVIVENIALEPPNFLQIEDYQEVKITASQFPAHLLWISIRGQI